ncbi:hypothetical protein [Pseudarthrobacter sp. S9]
MTSTEQSYDLAAQRRLWAISEELTCVTFPTTPSTTPAAHTES